MSELHVVFGTGAVGRAIMDELILRGKNVRMINRSGKLPHAPGGVEVVASDLYAPAKIREVTQDAQVVYQAAQPKYNEWTEKFPPLQKSIIEGLTGSSAKLVIVENFYMLGAPNGMPLTEDLPHNAHTHKGITRRYMSKAALAAHQDGKVVVAIGRGSDFFGPWGLEMATTMGSRQLYPLLEGKTVRMIGRPDIPHTHTYLKDFGKALVILGERAEANGQVWNIPNDQPQITQGEMMKMFAEEAGVTLKTSLISRRMLRLIGLFSPPAKEVVEMMYEFEQPFIVDSSKFENAFGMKATPMRTAIQETITWYKNYTNGTH
jgi:nucleoside-diphosphate-sugar epimerase